MAFPDPLSITIGATTHSLPRVSTAGRVATYANIDETVTLTISQIVTKSGRKRHEVRITWQKVVTDPVSTANDTDSTTLTYVIDRPGYGFTSVNIGELSTGFEAWLTPAFLDNLYGGQS